MDDNKMGFVDYLWAAFIFMLAMAAASCNPIIDEDVTIVCIEIYQPVCYKGKLYSNSCYAEAAGANNDEISPAMCIDYEPGYTGVMKPCPFCPTDD